MRSACILITETLVIEIKCCQPPLQQQHVASKKLGAAHFSRMLTLAIRDYVKFFGGVELALSRINTQKSYVTHFFFIFNFRRRIKVFDLTDGEF